MQCLLAPLGRVANSLGLTQSLQVSAFDIQAPGVALQRVINQTAAKLYAFHFFAFPFSVRLNKEVENFTVFKSDFFSFPMHLTYDFYSFCCYQNVKSSTME